jgi:flagellar biosynthesis/type III secretory pathway ATPase
LLPNLRARREVPAWIDHRVLHGAGGNGSFNEPVCDAVRSTSWPHRIAQLGAAGHYPAIEVLNSVSRLTSSITSREHAEWARKVREAMAAYQQAEDLIQLGAYVGGTNPKLDTILEVREELMEFLRQDASVKTPAGETLARLGPWPRSCPDPARSA